MSIHKLSSLILHMYKKIIIIIIIIIITKRTHYLLKKIMLDENSSFGHFHNEILKNFIFNINYKILPKWIKKIWWNHMKTLKTQMIKTWVDTIIQEQIIPQKKIFETGKLKLHCF